jgi:hypothetical protein
MSKSYVFIWYLIDLAELGCRNTNGLQIAKYYDGKKFFWRQESSRLSNLPTGKVLDKRVNFVACR